MQQQFCSSTTAANFVEVSAMIAVTDPADAAMTMRTARERRGWSTTALAHHARDLAQSAGLEIKLTQQSVSKFEQGDSKRVPVWYRYAMQALRETDDNRLPDLPASADPVVDYLSIPILPSFAGMGGGGNGEGDTEYGLVPRRLIEDELRAKPADFILIEARGDSMSPDFQHGDQILVDKRDVNPAQPGSFALWDGDAYVIKLIERVSSDRGRYRIFSANERYSAYEVSAEEVRIMGRPVWFARRL